MAGSWSVRVELPALPFYVQGHARSRQSLENDDLDSVVGAFAVCDRLNRTAVPSRFGNLFPEIRQCFANDGVRASPWTGFQACPIPFHPRNPHSGFPPPATSGTFPLPKPIC